MSDDDLSASPLCRLVGLLDEEEIECIRARSREWREAFDREMAAGDAPDTVEERPSEDDGEGIK